MKIFEKGACNLFSVIVNYNTRGAHQYIGPAEQPGQHSEGKEKVMFTMVAKHTHKTVSAVAAVAIVSFSGLVMDQGHVAAAPRGTVEVGELTLVDATQTTMVTLPEVTVVAKRITPADTYFAAASQLPEVVVVAKRVATLVTQSGIAGPAAPASVHGPVEGALLK
jgi:hypothetical protein